MGRPCSVEGCVRKHYARGLCEMHYKRWNATGDAGEAEARFMQGVPAEQRIRARSEERPAPPGLVLPCRVLPCRVFCGNLVGGYGRIAVDGGSRAVHVVMWELEAGRPVREGHELDHLCRIRACWEFTHLEEVTPRTNKLRGEGIMAKQARQTHCRNGHPLEGPDALLKPDPRLGRRICLVCVREARRRRYQRLRR